MSCNQKAMVVAVTHEMLSRTIQGAYLGLSPAETLKITHKHNVVYQLNDGCIKPIAIEPNAM